MRWITILFSLALVTAVQAGVYKWMDAEGNINYGDQPPTDGASSQVNLPGLSSYTPRPVPEKAQPEGKTAEEGKAQAKAYTRIAILEPENDATVRSNEGLVNVRIVLEPAIQPDHYVTLFLDGSGLGQKLTTSSLQLKGVERGAHELRVQVFDKNDKPLKQSDVIKFHLRRESKLLRKQPRS